MAKKRPWTPEETEMLKRLRSEGKDINECAAALGRSANAIGHKLYDKDGFFICAVERGRKLTEKQLQWVISHYRNTKNADIQRRYGISFAYLHRIAREYGLRKSTRFTKKCQAAASEAAIRSHIANGTYPPKGYRIPNGDKNRFKKGVTSEMRLGKARNRKRIEKFVRSLALRRKRERMLVFCGLPQKTKLRVVSQGKQKCSYLYGLRKCGYVQDEKDKNLFYYPAGGERHIVRESHGEKFGIRFGLRGKVRSDDIRFAIKADELCESGEMSRKAKPVAAFGQMPISSRIVSSLDAYSCDNSFLYDE